MPRIITAVASTNLPGLWQKLRVLSGESHLDNVQTWEIMGQLESLGIPRHQLGSVHMLQSWRAAGAPPDVALALWMLRDMEDGTGAIRRNGRARHVESGTAIRYIELATGLGEDPDTDAVMRRVADWLIGVQRDDGGIPLTEESGESEIGQTARTLRALAPIQRFGYRRAVRRMTGFLHDNALKLDGGRRAWPHFAGGDRPIVGSTSLAVAALATAGKHSGLVRAGLRFLLNAQHPSGGWSQTANGDPSLQATDQVVRTLHRTAELRLADGEDLRRRLRTTTEWLHRHTRFGSRLTTLKLCYAVRLAARLGLLHLPRYQRLLRTLLKRRNKVLHPEADLYSETVVWAITLRECAAESSNGEAGHAKWHWRLPLIQPPFLDSQTYAYEYLYGLIGRQWWFRVVDVLAGNRVIEHGVEIAMGTIVALSVFDDFMVDRLSAQAGEARHFAALAIVGVLVAAWLFAKATFLASWSAMLQSTTVTMAVGGVLTWVLFTPGIPAGVVALLAGLTWLIVDIVVYATDSSGLLDRILGRNG